MKYIQKEKEPEKLRSWFNSQFDEDGNCLGCDYRKNLPGDIKRDLKNHLLKEQGFLCCYTGILIDADHSHVEHLKPYALCRDQKKYEDVSYFNLLAAYPGPDYEDTDSNTKGKKKNKKCLFGAHAKDEWYDVENFVTPLNQNCETRFKFYEDGRIEATDDRDTAAKTTIEKLALNHPQLTDLRKAAIDDVFFSPDIELDESDFIAIADGAYSVKDGEGKYPEFCFVIEQVAKQLIDRG
jgi:uncharacterized protein (TIGR02646 family)